MVFSLNDLAVGHMRSDDRHRCDIEAMTDAGAADVAGVQSARRSPAQYAGPRSVASGGRTCARSRQPAW